MITPSMAYAIFAKSFARCFLNICSLYLNFDGIATPLKAVFIVNYLALVVILRQQQENAKRPHKPLLA
jgi:hypothetical protein